MASSNNRITGSITQRSFIPRDLGMVLNVATIPIDELGCKSSSIEQRNFLRNLTSSLTGVPSGSILDEAQYARLRRIAGERDSLMNLLDLRRGPFYYEVFHDYYDTWFKKLAETSNEEDSPTKRFALDSLALITSPQSSYLHGATLYPFYPFPQEYQAANKRLELSMPSETFQTGFACLLASLTSDERVSGFTSDLQEYHIPFGQSPKTESDSLLKLIESGKKMCLAPMAAAGVYGVTQLTQGAFLVALLTVGTGSAMSLMLIGALSVGDLITQG